MIIKVCGMREPDNIRAVEQRVRPSMMGFICYDRSPRYVGPVLPAYMPAPPVKRVGVFVNPTADYVVHQVQMLGLHAVQLHGHESPAFCSRLRQMLRADTMLIKAFGIASASDFDATNDYEADMLVFDTRCSEHGGSGRQFDWQVLDAYTGSTPFLLSGGIGPADAKTICHLHHPQLAGVDLNSRFELTPGMKDIDLLSDFASKLAPWCNSSSTVLQR